MSENKITGDEIIDFFEKGDLSEVTTLELHYVLKTIYTELDLRKGKAPYPKTFELLLKHPSKKVKGINHLQLSIDRLKEVCEEFIKDKVIKDQQNFLNVLWARLDKGGIINELYISNIKKWLIEHPAKETVTPET